MTSIVRHFHEPASLRYNGAALSCALAGYGPGLAGLFHPSLRVNLPATHREMFGDGPAWTIPLAAERAEVYGGNAASFLTAF